MRQTKVVCHVLVIGPGIVLTNSPSDISGSIIANNFQICVPMVAHRDSINKQS
jgi:hypothetical protein